MIQSLRSHQKTIFLLLSLIIGIAILFPFHDFQLHLAQGDHGRDLYAFAATMDGAQPYRDYWWVYGPLMPYYYSLFLILFGINIHSILLGYLLLGLLSGLLVYLTLSLFTRPLLALSGAVWFWVFNSPFEHTYNHAGGILVLLGIVYFTFSYIKNPKNIYLYLGLLGTLILSLIKVNFGLATFLSFIISIALIDMFRNHTQKKKFYFFACLAVPSLIAGIYLFLVRGLPVYVIRQCFPYFSKDHPFHSTIWDSLVIYFQRIIYVLGTHWAHNVLLVITLVSLVCLFFHIKNNKIDHPTRRNFYFCLLTILIFAAFNLHEFLISGVPYRAFWIKPFEILIPFLIIGIAAKDLNWKWLIPLCIIIMVSAFSRHNVRIVFANQLKSPHRYISLERGKIYTVNSPQWLSTVKYTVKYLNKNLKKDETFLALVDDPLYYFLTGKDSPTRVLAIGNHLNIHKNQELEIIQALEEKNVRYVLLSNRHNSDDPSMGRFGQTYCPTLYNYILKNYRSVFMVGEWKKPPRWFENHGVKILKRIN